MLTKNACSCKEYKKCLKLSFFLDMVAFDVLDWKCENICPKGSCTSSRITNFEFLVSIKSLVTFKIDNNFKNA